jgi:hypothetical protein
VGLVLLQVDLTLCSELQLAKLMPAGQDSLRSLIRLEDMLFGWFVEHLNGSCVIERACFVAQFGMVVCSFQGFHRMEVIARLQAVLYEYRTELLIIVKPLQLLFFPVTCNRSSPSSVRDSVGF